MSKKFLILTSRSSQSTSWKEREDYVRKFSHKLNEKLSGIEAVYSTYQDLEYTVLNGRISILDRLNERDLKDYDLVHFKNWRYEPQEAAIIALYLDWNGVTYFNSEVNSGFTTTKICQMILLAKNHVLVPNTFYAHKNRLIEIFTANKLPQGFSFPLIMKADDGSMGNDNFLLKSYSDALNILAKYHTTHKNFVLQNYIPNDGDYRLLYIGLDQPPLIFKRKAAAGSHLNNTSKGGQGEFVDGVDLTPQILNQAVKAAEVLKREIAGVDVIIDKSTNKAYVLEVNLTPALATGYGQDEKLDSFASFLDNVLETQEEE